MSVEGRLVLALPFRGRWTVQNPAAARAVPFTLPGGLPRGGQVVDAG